MSLNLISIQASQHAIKSVTVSKSSKAEVVRTFALELKKGQNKVEIKGLPSGIDTARPSGLGTARLDDFLYTVERTKPRSANGAVDVTTPSDSSSSETIRLLSVKLATVEKERLVREQESGLLLQYAQSLKGEHAKPADMTQFLDSYVKQMNQIISAVTELNEKIVDIKRQIADEETKAKLKTGEAHGKVMALISSDTDATITFTLTYIVRNCEWQPKYELHTSTENGRPSTAVSLYYLASISQNTGEDWTDATLTLSTTTTNLAPKHVPTSAPLKIRLNNPYMSAFGVGSTVSATSNNVGQNKGQAFNALFGGGGLFGSAQPQPLPQQQQRTNAFGLGQPAPASFGATSAFGATGASANQSAPNAAPPPQQLFGASPAPPSDPELSQAGYDVVGPDEYVPPGPESGENKDGPTTEPRSIVQETPLSMYFSVSGKASIPSDGLKHRVTLAVLPFESKISYVTIPRDDPTVFLQCEVKNSSEYRLITGSMDVIVDGSYISATLIRNDINPGETFVCVLGNDISTKVTYVRSCKINRPEASAFSEATVIATYTTKISIQNKHQYDLTDLVVRDRMPTSDDQRVRVILRRPLELGDTKQGQFVSLKDHDGLKVGWEKLYNGRGGEKEGKFEWRWGVKSGATVELVAEYDVKGPKDVGWDISAAPQFGN